MRGTEPLHLMVPKHTQLSWLDRLGNLATGNYNDCTVSYKDGGGYESLESLGCIGLDCERCLFYRPRIEQIQEGEAFELELYTNDF